MGFGLPQNPVWAGFLSAALLYGLGHIFYLFSDLFAVFPVSWSLDLVLRWPSSHGARPGAGPGFLPRRPARDPPSEGPHPPRAPRVASEPTCLAAPLYGRGAAPVAPQQLLSLESRGARVREDARGERRGVWGVRECPGSSGGLQSCVRAALRFSCF